MTTERPATLIRDSLLPGEPLTLDAAVERTGVARRAAVATLAHLTARGDLRLVRRGLWTRSGLPPDPYSLGARVTSPYAFAYGSALALNGAASAERTEVLVSSPHRFAGFEFEGIRYRWVRPWSGEGLVRLPGGPQFVWATGPERTLVDCVRVPANAGGIDEVMRAVDMLPRLDPDQVLVWLEHYGEAALAARLGFVLERVGRYERDSALMRRLAHRRPSHRVYLDPGRRGGRLVARWNLIVPPHVMPGPT